MGLACWSAIHTPLDSACLLQRDPARQMCNEKVQVDHALAGMLLLSRGGALFWLQLTTTEVDSHRKFWPGP